MLDLPVPEFELLPLDVEDAAGMIASADGERAARQAAAPLDQLDMAQFRRDEQAADLLRANGNGQLTRSMAA